jgi:hypothetical protein
MGQDVARQDPAEEDVASWRILPAGGACPPKRRSAVVVTQGTVVVTTWNVFYEKAPDVKAALAAVLTWSSELRSVPESSIRTLEESFVGLGALWGATAAALRSLRQPRRLRRSSAVADNGGLNASSDRPGFLLPEIS